MVEVLVSLGRGCLVSWREARPGDLVQFWRNTSDKPSGHSAIVLGVDGDLLTYGSSQRSTDGVGVHTERVQATWRVFCVRPTWPVP